MTLPDDYLKYPKRRYGMDHDRYDWSICFDRKKRRMARTARASRCGSCLSCNGSRST